MGATFDEPTFAAVQPPLIPQGEYGAQCISVEILTFFSRQKKYRLIFKILPELNDDISEPVVLEYYANIPPTNRCSIASKVYQDFVRGRNGEHPLRNDRVNFSSFKNGIFQVLVQTVMNDSHKKQKEKVFHYSKVEKILKRDV